MEYGIVLMVIEGIITGHLMIKIMNIVIGIKSPKSRLRVFRFLTSTPVSFAMNLAISTMLTWFTGGGLTAGFANLGSSILVGFGVPIYLKSKFDIVSLENEVKALEETKREKKQKKEKPIDEGNAVQPGT